MKKPTKDKLWEFADRFWQSNSFEKIIITIGSLYFTCHILVAMAKAKGWI
jgi:hypothetical protein